MEAAASKDDAALTVRVARITGHTQQSHGAR